MENIKYKISKHAQERFAERVMDKDNLWDINYFISQNEEKIQNDIEKMITFGELIYKGKQKDSKGRENTIDVFRKDCWIILVDVCLKNVITLYKIDLGCGNDFNADYVSRMVEKIKAANEEVESVKEKITEEQAMYRDMIKDNTDQIMYYKSCIKNLENLNKAYQDVVDNDSVKITQANKNVAELVNTLIAKKEF